VGTAIEDFVAARMAAASRIRLEEP